MIIYVLFFLYSGHNRAVSFQYEFKTYESCTQTAVNLKRQLAKGAYVRRTTWLCQKMTR